MKKNLAILAALMVAAVSASAQGTVAFANSPTSLVTRDGISLANTANGRVQLAWAAEGVSLTAWSPDMTLASWLGMNPGVSLIDGTANVGVPLAGRFSGGAKTIPTAVAGGVVQGVVIGWAGPAVYANFDAAFAAQGFVGVSAPFIVDTANPLATPSPEPAAAIANFTGLSLVPAVVPEPSSMLLAGLGAAALLIFRRRN